MLGIFLSEEYRSDEAKRVLRKIGLIIRNILRNPIQRFQYTLEFVRKALSQYRVAMESYGTRTN